MRFFTDQNVPESVARVLEDSGYAVVRLREKTAPSAPDALVAAVAEANSAILVTNDSDFKSIASRTGIGRRAFRFLSLIRFEKCRESKMANRIKQFVSLIEHEWGVGGGARDRRIFIVICDSVVRSYR
jgi:predicted nuclease of predicted toxin-antitoxin system